MYKVSSKTTYFHTTIFKWILIISFLIGVILYLVLKLSDTFLFAIIFAFIMFYLVWYFNGRKYKIVYLGDDFFTVDDEKIPFKTISSIDGHFNSPSFTVNYKINNESKKFSYLPKYYFPFLTPYYIKEIRGYIKNRKKANSAK